MERSVNDKLISRIRELGESLANNAEEYVGVDVPVKFMHIEIDIETDELFPLNDFVVRKSYSI